MTLTDILPTLRRTLPVPLSVDCWPELTAPTTVDVVMAGVSLLRFAELCGTPCVHGGAGVIAGTGGRPSQDADCSVIIAAVHQVDNEANVRLDARLSALPVVWSEARLLGRISTAYVMEYAVSGPGGGAKNRVTLPGDLRVGDVIAVPCPGAIVLSDVRGGRSDQARRWEK